VSVTRSRAISIFRIYSIFRPNRVVQAADILTNTHASHPNGSLHVLWPPPSPPGPARSRLGATRGALHNLPQHVSVTAYTLPARHARRAEKRTLRHPAGPETGPTTPARSSATLRAQPHALAPRPKATARARWQYVTLRGMDWALMRGAKRADWAVWAASSRPVAPAHLR
jgi:hypothetical protein